MRDDAHHITVGARETSRVSSPSAWRRVAETSAGISNLAGNQHRQE